jgi:ferric-dicitrate binding protein FerR (iron transport regulator)
VVDAVARFDASRGRAVQRDAAASLVALTTRLEQDERLFSAPRRPKLRTSPLTTQRSWIAPVAAAVVLVAAAGAWMSGARHHPPGAQREYATGQDERATIQLSDGSRVVLGPGSRIRYAEPFGDGDRNVYLEGKAYFTVAQRQAAPFVVLTPTSATQVLGTAFVVKAMPRDSNVRVSVESGKVALRSRDSHPGTGTTLARGEVGLLEPGGLTTVSHDAAVDSYSMWTHEQIRFVNAPIDVILRTIQERYDIEIVLPHGFPPTTQTSIGLDVETSDQAAQMLAGALDLTYTRKGRVVTLRSKL